METIPVAVAARSYKHLPVLPETWEKLSKIKNAGETWDELMRRLMQAEATSIGRL